MNEKSNLLLEVKSLHNLVRRRIDSMPSDNDEGIITGMQGFVIGYLFKHKEEEVFQRDIEAAFLIRRSTATGILKLMEEKGLIERKPVPSDARLKKLTLTAKGIGHHQNFLAEMDRLEICATKGLTEAEVETFLTTLIRIKHNIE